MATTDEVIQRLHDSRPPATDSFTYLTIIEQSLSPEILPELEEILEDDELTRDIGWDLVQMLIPVPGSEHCLEKIARLGNPREVIIKVLEALGTSRDTVDQDNPDDASRDFVALTGMLGILHGRLQVKTPSRFLRSTLDTVLRAYNPESSTATAAVVHLIRALSGRKRPPLPTRQSSTKLETPFQGSDPTQGAPDPEAQQGDKPDETDSGLSVRLLQSFITRVIERYCNGNRLEWAARLLEYTYPERIVPGRLTLTKAFREVPGFQKSDALIGQLIAAAGDLGLANLSPADVKRAFEGPIFKDALYSDEESQKAEDVELSTGGFICIIAYRMFAQDVFDADYDIPPMTIFPDHHALLKHTLELDESSELDIRTVVVQHAATFDALVAMGLYLLNHDGLAADAAASSDIMSYHHLLTLISLFHPSLQSRNAATVLAGQILHADPDEGDRLAILEDLLENCMFSSLQACAVTWLREEIIAAHKAGSQGRFSSTDLFAKLQYTLFPDLRHLSEADAETLVKFWRDESAFHLQVANFALFLFTSKEYKELAPSGMAAAAEVRYVEPLVQAAKALAAKLEKGEFSEEDGPDSELRMQLNVLTDTLGRVPL